MMKEYQIKFSEEELNIVIYCLRKQIYELVDPVITKIVEQVKLQQSLNKSEIDKKE